MKSFKREDILLIRKALKDDASGNKECTMTDLALAYDMLGELLSLKHNENSIITMAKRYFAHPNTTSKTKKKEMRKIFRKLLVKTDTYIRE